MADRLRYDIQQNIDESIHIDIHTSDTALMGNWVNMNSMVRDNKDDLERYYVSRSMYEECGDSYIDNNMQRYSYSN